MTRKLLPALTAVLTAVSVLAACSSPAEEPPPEAVIPPPAGLIEDGYLTYGTAASFPPFESKENGEPVGFDIDMGNKIADYLGLRTRVLDIDFDGLVPALQGGRVDIINSAMYINEERAAVVDYVPYMKIGESLIGNTDKKIAVKELPKDLSGKTVAVTRGAIGETYMNDFNQQLKAAGLPPMEVMALPNNQDALLAVQSGRADLFDTSTPGAAHTIAKSGDRFEVVNTFALDTQIGIAVPKNKPQLKAAMQQAVQRFIDSGQYDELLTKYNLPTDSKLSQ
ncbi:ABC transporter substrate-binding protein [Mycolicibacterium mageritense]|uniref:Glutamine-binding periplasmic protein n=1 Tax=Mycolicibacterium mageritense TaxID=53462 RepID=A0AAI8XLB4_MYCME|nr:ABC transporter substrate-binding protein [Mycolicibacterium mageritense]BDY26696.1 Glutamine-binding periplasmic protein [Mycolicibacterium mageritense]